MPRVLHPMAEEMLHEIPPFFRGAPEFQAIYNAYALTLARFEGTLAEVRANLNPLTATELGMGWWEYLVGVTVNPAGVTLEDRRATVLAFLQGLITIGSGLRWTEAIGMLLGPGWSYEEHDPFNPLGPPAYTVRIHVPFNPTGSTFAQLERFARVITPAHIDLVFSGPSGFTLDRSQLDQEPLQA